MKVKNVSTTKLLVGDMLFNGYPLELDVQEEKIIFDKDAEKSAALTALITAGQVQVTDESAEPVEIGHGEMYVLYKTHLVTLASAIEDLAARVTALEG